MFTQFEFPREVAESLGLQPAKLHGLGPMVVLVGPNGAGKSRYLKLAEKIIENAKVFAERVDYLQTRLNRRLGPAIVGFPGQLERELAEAVASIPQGLKVSVPLTTVRVVNLTYEERDYGRHPLSVPPDDVDRVVAANRQGGFSNAIASVYDYFFEVARAIYEARHPDTQEHPDVQSGLDDAKAFNQILKALLNTDVCIRALDALRKDILGPEGQIWLATHSVPLIAHAGIESVHLVDKNSIEYAGNKTEKVLERLLGGQDGRAKLRALMADADEIAFDNFAAQCLLPPGVVSAQEGDPQQLQMVHAARVLGAGKENIHILDFAAGRGRLAAALKSAELTENRRFTYHAFQDPDFSDPQDRRECLEHIRSLEQPRAPETYLVDTLEGFTVRDAEKMDLVVMCNVLHEIPVADWQRDFEHIHDVLAKDGHLVILEDQLPSVGELPHANGYVILNEPALQHLFDSKDAVIRVSVEKGERLTAFAIPRRFLKRVTSDTIGRALASIKRMADDRISSIRNKKRGERSFQDGRQHAHFTLLYANAHLASHQFREPDQNLSSLPSA